jgi:hypothetical protein
VISLPHAFLGVLAIGFAAGWVTHGWKTDSQKLQTVETTVAQVDNAAEKHEAARVQIRTQFRTIYRDVEKIIDRPVYHSACLDDDGLRQLQRAISGDTAASKPAGPVPEAERP